MSCRLSVVGCGLATAVFAINSGSQPTTQNRQLTTQISGSQPTTDNSQLTTQISGSQPTTDNSQLTTDN